MNTRRAGVKILASILTMGAVSFCPILTEAAVSPGLTAINANVSDAGITPYWSSARDVYCDIDSDEGYVYSEAHIQAETDSEKFTGTMYLEKYKSGKWVKVKSWGISGKGSKDISKRYRGVAGVEYRVRVVVKVGTDQIEEVSDSCVV